MAVNKEVTEPRYPSGKVEVISFYCRHNDLVNRYEYMCHK